MTTVETVSLQKVTLASKHFDGKSPFETSLNFVAKGSIFSDHSMSAAKKIP